MTTSSDAVPEQPNILQTPKVAFGTIPVKSCVNCKINSTLCSSVLYLLFQGRNQQ